MKSYVVKPFIYKGIPTPSEFQNNPLDDALTLEQWAALIPGDQVQVIKPTHGPLLVAGTVLTVTETSVSETYGCMVHVGERDWCAERFRRWHPSDDVTHPERSLTKDLLHLFQG